MDIDACFFFGILGLFCVFFGFVPTLNQQAATARAARATWLSQNPHAITWLQLVKNANYDSCVVVRAQGGSRECLAGFSGQAAERQFELLCVAAPQASHILCTNGVNQVLPNSGLSA